MTRARKNHDDARRYFGILGNKKLHLHHKDITLRHTNKERYDQWNIEDLEVVTIEEHSKIHMKGNTYAKGISKSEETKKKMSEAAKGHKGAAEGKHWYNNGVIEVYDFTCPEGFNKGRLKGLNEGRTGAANGKHWFNNGEVETYAFECPEGYIAGRLTRKKRYAELTEI